MILTAVTFLVILTILVLIHELGHFLVARWIGVHVEEFGLGLPPRIWGKKIGSTEYTLNWLPIGGFVRLAGEDAEADQRPHVKGSKLKEYFWARSKKERSAILIAGVAMNFALAVFITAGVLISGVKEPSDSVHIDRVVAGSPAEKAGFRANDIVRSVALFPQTPINIIEPSDLIGFVGAHKGTEIVVIVERNGKAMSLRATPRVDVPPGEGPLGVAVSDLEFGDTVIGSSRQSVIINIIRPAICLFLWVRPWELVTLRPPQADVARPIGIAQVTGQAVKFGMQAVLNLPAFYRSTWLSSISFRFRRWTEAGWHLFSWKGVREKGTSGV